MPVDPAELYIETHYKDRITTAAVGSQEVGRIIVRDQLNQVVPYWYIYGLYVDGEYRREGVGTALLTTVVGMYGSDRLELVAHSPEVAAMSDVQLAAWYARFGFVPELSASGRRYDSDPWRMARPSGFDQQ